MAAQRFIQDADCLIDFLPGAEDGSYYPSTAVRGPNRRAEEYPVRNIHDPDSGQAF